jgi:hypothetical protein
MAADANASGLEFLLKARTPIAPSKFLVAGAKMRSQPVILMRTGTLGPTTPCVIATARHR